ncbi:MAG: class I SAM-dependent methyltransferase [Flavobacteriaceae bacterium]
MTSNPLLKKQIQEFIRQNIGADVGSLSLKNNPFVEVDYKEILNQIEAKTKAQHKLPTWFKTENILYPSKISIEQTSSEITAKYKSDITSGNRIIDLTGGFGVDCYYFSQVFKEVLHCEINPQLSQIVEYNFKVLGKKNITCYAQDSLEVLKTQPEKFDWIYIDPSRRNDLKGKVFLLKDCLPDVTVLLEEYFAFSDNILIKTSPIYDISVGISELQNVRNIHIVSVENEVKELLFELKKGYEDSVTVKTINFTKNKTETFDFELDNDSEATLSEPEKYLYEPNAALMKSQGFGSLSKALNISKLHKHSHLFTSDKLIDFQGRSFEIERILPYKKEFIKKELQGKKANISVRNFPETVAQIRKKWKIKEGGDRYVFFTTNLKNEKIVVLCRKI